MPEKKRYKNPPIVERIVGVYHELSMEEFEQKLPSWIEKIRGSYPLAENLSEWTIDLERKDGVPVLKNLEPKARLIRLFWKPHPEHLHVFGMRLRADRLVFHLRRERDNSHDFEELMPEMEKWLPLWAEHFGVPHIKSVTVEYYNVLNGLITPTLTRAGAVIVGDALTVFGNIPGTYQGITDPYDCKVRLIIDEKDSTYFDLRVRGEAQTGAVKVNFIVRSGGNDQKMSLHESIKKLYSGHEVILEQFSCIFTEKAKVSFGLTQ